MQKVIQESVGTANTGILSLGKLLFLDRPKSRDQANVGADHHRIMAGIPLMVIHVANLSLGADEAF